MEPIIVRPTDVNKEYGDKILCEDCGAMIAKKKGFGMYEVRWGKLEVMIHGRAIISCRICGRRNEL